MPNTGGFMYARISSVVRAHRRDPDKAAEIILNILRHASTDMIRVGEEMRESGSTAKEIWQEMIEEALGEEEYSSN